MNQYLSVKKYAPYRKDNNWDKTRGDRLKELKQSVAERSKGAHGVGVGADSASGRDVNGERVKKRKGKKERMKMKAADDEGRDGEVSVAAIEDKDGSSRKRKHVSLDEADEEREGGSSEKKKRRRRKKAVQEQTL